MSGSGSGSAELILRTDHGPVAVLTLNRPDRRNALSRELIAALGDGLDRIEVESGIRAVVLTGQGTVFCAGMDLKRATIDPPGDAEAEHAAVADTQAIADLIDQVHRLPKPTIAALNGDALAGGAGLALACDFVLAAPGCRIGFPEVRRGLVASIVLHDLIRQVGIRRARQLLLTGTPIPVAEAESWGLINRVVGPEASRSEAIALGHSLVNSGPAALATTKRLIDEASLRPRDLRGAAAITAAVRITDEAQEGMRAFLEKRTPTWASPPSA